jgi:hypothetical protein
MLFEKENEKNFTKNAILHRNILEYLFEEHGHKPFRFTELAKFLMRKNYEFRDYYKDHLRNVTMTHRIANHRQRIQKCIDNLVNSRLLIIFDRIKSKKNELKTPLYAFSIEGKITALLSSYNTNYEQKEERRLTEDKLFELVYQVFSRYNSHVTDFLLRIYIKAKDKGFSESVAVLLIKILQSNIPIKYVDEALRWTVYFHLEKGHNRNEFFNIYMETLYELPERARRIIMYHEKCEIESRFHLYQPPREWEEAWVNNIHDCHKIALYGVCTNQKCNTHYPVIIDYLDYRKEIFSRDHLNRSCEKCKTQDSVHVYNTLEKNEIRDKLGIS